jgi:hypothetical protein
MHQTAEAVLALLLLRNGMLQARPQALFEVEVEVVKARAQRFELCAWQ